ncbi:uncharacterized protein LOC115454364 [Manduca sexta]|uniref:uncharacterized protein LOC115454364 n=1 Tax=Manduca sexta TaxID=7130 RepID=UPI001183418A|nr:uncharacterized protein LOC115454364 [Manduca sexta]KAG6438710.1 hypothetical protein O3G_MSEX000165 [Manduca sexta]
MAVINFVKLMVLSLFLTSSSVLLVEEFLDFFNPYSVDVKDLDKFAEEGLCHKCPKVYLPVCGDDNLTYISECRLACINVHRYNKQNKTVKMVRLGPCRVFPDDYS